MTEKQECCQLGMKIYGSTVEILKRMAEEAGTTPTTVAKDLLYAAVQQAERGSSKPLPPHLRRFYGESPDDIRAWEMNPNRPDHPKPPPGS